MPHAAMSESESERQRLAGIYAEMSDAALLELAAQPASLTEIAKSVLLSEMSARSLEVPVSFSEHPPAQEPPAQISGPLVMVKRFRDMPEAEVAASLLDSAGIDCFLADENTIRMDWLWSNLLGGFKLMVRPDDLEEAKRILEEANLAGLSEETETNNESGDTKS